MVRGALIVVAAVLLLVPAAGCLQPSNVAPADAVAAASNSTLAATPPPTSILRGNESLAVELDGNGGWSAMTWTVPASSWFDDHGSPSWGLRFGVAIDDKDVTFVGLILRQKGAELETIGSTGGTGSGGSAGFWVSDKTPTNVSGILLVAADAKSPVHVKLSAEISDYLAKLPEANENATVLETGQGAPISTYARFDFPALGVERAHHVNVTRTLAAPMPLGADAGSVEVRGDKQDTAGIHMFSALALPSGGAGLWSRDEARDGKSTHAGGPFALTPFVGFLPFSYSLGVVNASASDAFRMEHGAIAEDLWDFESVTYPFVPADHGLALKGESFDMHLPLPPGRSASTYATGATAVFAVPQVS